MRIAVAGLLLLASSANAGDLKTSIALALADLGTTEVILAQGGHEANPLLRARGARIAIKAAAVAGTLKLAEGLEKRGRPGRAKVLRVTLIVIQAFCVAHNLRELTR